MNDQANQGEDEEAQPPQPPPVSESQPQSQAEEEEDDEEEEEEEPRNEDDELIAKAQKLMEKITSSPENPSSSALHALASLLETQESRYAFSLSLSLSLSQTAILEFVCCKRRDWNNAEGFFFFSQNLKFFEAMSVCMYMLEVFLCLCIFHIILIISFCS